MAVTFKPSFGRLDGTVDASGATDHDALLEASELMPVGAEQVFEKAHSISAHDCKSLFAFTIGLWRTEGFDLAQHRAACFGEISSKPAAQVLPVDYHQTKPLEPPFARLPVRIHYRNVQLVSVDIDQPKPRAVRIVYRLRKGSSCQSDNREGTRAR
jgi:hypothetical protein